MINTTRILIIGLLLFLIPANALGEKDLFAQTRSDSSVRMVKFPLSMLVRQSRPAKGLYYFFQNGDKRFDDGLEGTPGPGGGAFDAAASDAKSIKKTLVSVDLARVNPASQGDDLRGPVTRAVLREWSKKNSERILFVFKREIHVTGELAASDFLEPAGMLNPGTAGSDLSLRIRTLGFLYLTKQNKVLVLPPNEQSAFLASGSGEAERAEQVKSASREGLKQLAEAAKKEIHSRRFEKRQSAY